MTDKSYKSEHDANEQQPSDSAVIENSDSVNNESIIDGPEKDTERCNSYDSFHLNPSNRHPAEKDNTPRQDAASQKSSTKKNNHSDSESTVHGESETSDDVENRSGVKLQIWHYLRKLGKNTFLYFVLGSIFFILGTFIVKKDTNFIFYKLINVDPPTYEEITVNCRLIGYTLAFIIFFIGVLAVVLKFSLTHIESSIDISQDYLTIICDLNIHLSIIIVLFTIVLILIYRGNLNLQFAKETYLDCGHIVNTLLFSTMLMAIKSYYLRSVSLSFDHVRHLKRVRAILRDSFLLKFLKAIKKLRRKERDDQIRFTVPISAEQQRDTTNISQSELEQIREEVQPYFGQDFEAAINGENIHYQPRPRRRAEQHDNTGHSYQSNQRYDPSDTLQNSELGLEQNHMGDTRIPILDSASTEGSKKKPKKCGSPKESKKTLAEQMFSQLHDHDLPSMVDYPKMVTDLGEKFLSDGLFSYLYCKAGTAKLTRKDQTTLKKIFYRLSPRDISYTSTKYKWREKASNLKKYIKCETLEDLKEFFCCEKFFLLWINSMKITHILKNYQETYDHDTGSSSEAEAFDKFFQPQAPESPDTPSDQIDTKNDSFDQSKNSKTHFYGNRQFTIRTDFPELDENEQDKNQEITLYKDENSFILPDDSNRHQPQDKHISAPPIRTQYKKSDEILKSSHYSPDKADQPRLSSDLDTTKHIQGSPDKDVDQRGSIQGSPDQNKNESRIYRKSPNNSTNNEQNVNNLSMINNTALPLESEGHVPHMNETPYARNLNPSKHRFESAIWSENYEIEQKMAHARNIVKNPLSVSLIYKFIERRDSELFNLQRTIEQNNAAINRVSNVLTLLIFVLAISIFLSISLNKTDKTIDILSALFGTGFILNTTIKDAISSCVFVFCVQPYDIGDRIFINIDNNVENLIVTEINVLSTKFIKFDGLYVIIPNNVLNTKSITNVRRSALLSESFYIDVKYDTPTTSLEKLKYNISFFLRSNPNLFTEFFYFNYHHLEDCNKLTLRIFIQYVENWQQYEKYLERRGFFLSFLNRCLIELNIRYRPLVQPLYFVDNQ